MLFRALFHDATTTSEESGSGGGITFEALKAQLTKHEGLLQVSVALQVIVLQEIFFK
jgi:hypothetical protein